MSCGFGTAESVVERTWTSALLRGLASTGLVLLVGSVVCGIANIVFNILIAIVLEMGVESDIILPKPYLSALAENPPMNTDELAHGMKDSPSRVEKYGAQILKILGVKNAN